MNTTDSNTTDLCPCGCGKTRADVLRTPPPVAGQLTSLYAAECWANARPDVFPSIDPTAKAN